MSKAVTVYWSTGYDDDPTHDWAILHTTPQSMYDEKAAQVNRQNSKRTMIECPSFRSLARRTFVIRAPMTSAYEVVGNDVMRLMPQTLSADISHEPNFTDNILVNVTFPHIFFADEPMMTSVTSPYFDPAPHLKYGAICPGEFDAGRWFRPINLLFNLWAGNKRLEFKEGEALAYMTFDTDRGINLKRFHMTPELNRIARTCADASLWEPRVPITKRYMRFRESKQYSRTLDLIRANLVE